MTTLIPRNTTIPTRKSEIVLDGDRQPDERRSARAAGRAPAGARQPHARDASSWSACRRRRAACRRSKSTFDIDANGIVNVSAKDMATGKEQKITISGSTRSRQRRSRSHGQRRRGARGGRQGAPRADRRAQPGRLAGVLGREDGQREPRQAAGGRRGSHREARFRPSATRARATMSRPSSGRPTHCSRRRTPWRRPCMPVRERRASGSTPASEPEIVDAEVVEK